MKEKRKNKDPLSWAAVPRRRASDWLMFKMRVPVIIASVVCSLTSAEASYSTPQTPTATTAKKTFNSRKQGLNIRVEGSGWGLVRKDEIETVLYSVADELLSRVPKKLAASIIVTHTESNPIALYQRGPQGEYLVHLHAKGDNWHFYVYEFAHELCHILSNYEENSGADTSKYNQWFEETLCETASLFTLKNLAESWEKNPPAPQWATHGAKLRRFYDLLINEGHRKLPPHSPLANWLRDHEETLRKNPYLREKNEVVANLLLPLFEGNPENWDALTYLNQDPADARNSLQQYLKNWYANAPAGHKVFIARVLTLLWYGDTPMPIGPGTAPIIAGDDSMVAASAGVAGQEAEKPPE